MRVCSLQNCAATAAKPIKEDSGKGALRKTTLLWPPEKIKETTLYRSERKKKEKE